MSDLILIVGGLVVLGVLAAMLANWSRRRIGSESRPLWLGLWTLWLVALAAVTVLAMQVRVL